MVAGQSYHVPLPPLRLSSRLHQGWWWGCEVAGTGSLSRRSSPQGADRSLHILEPVVVLGWDREYSTGL